MCQELRRQVERARRSGNWHWSALLPQEIIDKAFSEARSTWNSRIYTPAVTMWLFLAQVLSADGSCRDAVAGLVADSAARGGPRCSSGTGGYCIARDRIPETACHRLVTESGKRISDRVPQESLWQGRRVRLVDGSSVTMADTPENQRAYPQSNRAKPGCGFPLMRIVVVFCLASGTVLEAAFGRFKGKGMGELSLFRPLWEVLERNDVLLADRHYAGWFDFALLERYGVDVVARQHHSRTIDFRRGKRLGPNDHLIIVPKPVRCPDWLTREDYDRLPDELVLREVRTVIRQKGFRTKEVVTVTTLVHHERFTSQAIGELYRMRWQVELNLRTLKTVMQMEHLRCKEPHRVRNELRTHLLAYNLIRGVMLDAAILEGRPTWQVSFKGAMQLVNRFLSTLTATSAKELDRWLLAMLTAIGQHTVADRPPRIQPRVIKRRPKSYPRLNQPRSEYKKRLAA